MGYKLTSLVNLPVDDTVSLYVFSIGDDLWQGGLGEIVHRNFDNIAREIGGDAIIVGALSDFFHEEVVQQYLGVHHHELKNELPALLITDAHPSDLNNESMRVLIPLRKAHEVYPIIDNFLSDLAAFARGDSEDLLVQLEEGLSIKEAAEDIVKFNIPVVPGVVSVNLNNTFKHLKSWWMKNKNKKK